MIKKLMDFLKTDIWRIHAKKLPRQHFFFIRWLRVFILAIREFRSNKCQLNASALTFYSLLSIVPMAAMAFGIAKGFGFEKVLEKQLLEKFPAQEASLGQIITFANNLLENTRGGLVAGLGVILLFWTVIKVLDSVENSFDDIWGIKKGRSFSRKVSDYLSMMLICPFLIIASSGVTVFITTQVKMILERFSYMGQFAGLILWGLNFLPYVMIWLLFIFVYIFMPNTKVNLVSGIIGGIIAGTLYQVVQVIYITFQVGVANANAIYGSFAALPLFLIWLQVSWRVVLFGTELVFAHQNVDTYEFEHDCLNVSPKFKALIACQMTSMIAKRFSEGQKPFTAAMLSDELDTPIRLVRDVLFELTETGILTEIRETDSRQPVYQPAVDINRLTLDYVLKALVRHGTQSIPLAETESLKRIAQSIKDFEEQVKNSPSNRLLKDF